MPKPDISPERMQRLPLTEAIAELRRHHDHIQQQIDALDFSDEEREAFRDWVETFLAKRHAGPDALDEMQVSLLAIKPAAGAA
jgi:hypothetical protein